MTSVSILDFSSKCFLVGFTDPHWFSFQGSCGRQRRRPDGRERVLVGLQDDHDEVEGIRGPQDLAAGHGHVDGRSAASELLEHHGHAADATAANANAATSNATTANATAADDEQNAR